MSLRQSMFGTGQWHGLRSLGTVPLRLVDVGGANRLPSPWARVGSSLSVISFEPDTRSSVSATARATTTTVPAGLAGRKGTRLLHLTRKPELTSLFEPDFDLVKMYQGAERWEVLDRLEVPVTTLDSSLAGAGRRHDALKLDVQGAELEILQGAMRTLSEILLVQVEVEFVELYRGQPLFGHVDEFLRSREFVLADLDIHRWHRKSVTMQRTRRPDSGEIIFADAVYMRDPASIPAESLEVAIALSMLFRLPALALAYAARLTERPEVVNELQRRVRPRFIDRIALGGADRLQRWARRF